MTEPLVSVQMITYNQAPWIGRAIEGVLGQRAPFPFELVIGEDRSVDGTGEIVREYQRKYPEIIRIVTSETNVGIRENGYRTAKACRGKYVGFCEGDDCWHHPGKMKKQAEWLETHPRCGLVYSDYDVHFPGSGKTVKDFIRRRRRRIPENPGVAEIVNGDCGILTCTVMVRRSLYEQVIEEDPFLYRGSHFLMGDTQRWAGIGALAEVHYLAESLATHTVLDESASRSRDIKKSLRFKKSGAELNLYLCQKYGLPSRIREKYEMAWCNYALRLAFHTRDIELAEEVRKRKKALAWKEWLRYSGAKHPLVYFGYRGTTVFLNRFVNLFRREGDKER